MSTLMEKVLAEAIGRVFWFLGALVAGPFVMWLVFGILMRFFARTAFGEHIMEAVLEGSWYVPALIDILAAVLVAAIGPGLLREQRNRGRGALRDIRLASKIPLAGGAEEEHGESR